MRYEDGRLDDNILIIYAADTITSANSQDAVPADWSGNSNRFFSKSI
jgi:hypothetical protein